MVSRWVALGVQKMGFSPHCFSGWAMGGRLMGAPLTRSLGAGLNSGRRAGQGKGKGKGKGKTRGGVPSSRRDTSRREEDVRMRGPSSGKPRPAEDNQVGRARRSPWRRAGWAFSFLTMRFGPNVERTPFARVRLSDAFPIRYHPIGMRLGNGVRSSEAG